MSHINIQLYLPTLMHYAECGVRHCRSCHTDTPTRDLFGITDTALTWFSSYLSGRSQCVSINGETSDCYPLPFGVPQGSCLGPLLFSAYASKLFEVIKLYLPNAHAFADDTQLYLSFNPDNSLNEAEAGHAMWNSVFAP